MEKRLNKLFDELTPVDAALAGDECRIERYDEERAERILSLTQRKAGITMTETTNTQKKRRRIKRTTFIAIAAAAVLSCTAAAAGRAVIGFAYGFEQVTDAAAVQGRDEVDAGKVDKAQTEVQHLFDLLTHVVAQTVPLVDDNNQ